MTNVGAVVSSIQRNTADNGWFGLDRNDQMQQVARDLKALTPSERQEVVSKLSDADLKELSDDVNASGVLGASGLSQDENRDLFNDLAAGLDGQQLGRLAKAFDSREDVMALGQAVATNGSPTSKVDFIKSLAADATQQDSDPQRSGWLSVSLEEGDKQAEAISDVLSSMKGNGPQFAQAVNALSSDQLAAVVKAGVNETLTTTPNFTQGGGSSRTISFDTKQLNGLLDAARGTQDVGAKAKLFQAATAVSGEVRNAGGLLVPNMGGDDAVKGITDHLVKLVDSDTRGIVGELRRQDSLGTSLKGYMKDVLGQDTTAGNEAIGRQLAQMQGAGTGQTPTDFFHAKSAGDNGEPYSINAAELGYFAGGVRAGLDSLKTDQQAKRDQLIAVITTSVTVGTTVIPGLNVAAKAGTSITTAVVSQAVRDHVSAQGKDLDALGQTFYKLAMPEGAGNSAAAEAFKVNALEVRGQ